MCEPPYERPRSRRRLTSLTFRLWLHKLFKAHEWLEVDRLDRYSAAYVCRKCGVKGKRCSYDGDDSIYELDERGKYI